MLESWFGGVKIAAKSCEVKLLGTSDMDIDFSMAHMNKEKH